MSDLDFSRCMFSMRRDMDRCVLMAQTGQETRKRYLLARAQRLQRLLAVFARVRSEK